MGPRRLAIVVIGIVLAAGACGSRDPISIDGEWARKSPEGASTGVVYMQVTSRDADRLIGVAVDSSVASAAEIHESAAMGDDDGAGTGSLMSMRQVNAIVLPAGASVDLEPGGFHIMLVDLASPLGIGDSFDLTLNLENASPLVVEIAVRENAP